MPTLPARPRAALGLARPPRRTASSAPAAASRRAPVCCARSKNWLRWSNANANTSSRGVRGAVTRCRRVSVASWSGRGMRVGVGEEIVELDARGHRRRAAVPRHDQRAAGVGVARAGVVVLAAHPAGQEARRERVAGAQHVQHLDLDALAVERVVERARESAPSITAQPIGAALDDERRRRQPRAPRCSDAMMSVLPPAMLNSSIVPITRSNCGRIALQVRGDGVGRDVARLAVAALGEPPQHRPVVDVEHRAHVVARARARARGC